MYGLIPLPNPATGVIFDEVVPSADIPTGWFTRRTGSLRGRAKGCLKRPWYAPPGRAGRQSDGVAGRAFRGHRSTAPTQKRLASFQGVLQPTGNGGVAGRYLSSDHHQWVGRKHHGINFATRNKLFNLNTEYKVIRDGSLHSYLKKILLLVFGVSKSRCVVRYRTHNTPRTDRCPRRSTNRNGYHTSGSHKTRSHEMLVTPGGARSQL